MCVWPIIKKNGARYAITFYNSHYQVVLSINLLSVSLFFKLNGNA